MAEQRRLTTGALLPLSIGSVVALYTILFLVFNGLRFAPEKDETHFWPTTQLFSERFPHDLELLRSYNELNTPLPFIIFGGLERWFGLGIRAGRFLNLLTSISVILAIIATGGHRARAALAATGLMIFPYFLGTSIFLYTDMMAAALALLGLWLHTRARFLASALAFMMAIASRQYMVAFPLAVAAHEFFSRSCARTDQPRKLRWPAFAWILPTIAAASLLAWIGVFGGPAPHRAIETQRLATADAVSVFPQHSLYFLSSIGVYFVLVETMLFWRWQELAKAIRSRRAWIAAVLLIAAFVLFPPLKNLNYDIESMGYLDLALRAVMGDGPRVAVLCLLAVLVCARWRQINLAWWLLSLNAVVMMKAHIGWDKYALALLMSLWWLKARGNLDESPGQA